MKTLREIIAAQETPDKKRVDSRKVQAGFYIRSVPYKNEPVTVVIPHCNTNLSLTDAVSNIQWQDTKTEIVIIDTGSSCLPILYGTRLIALDLESVFWGTEAVGIANDIGQALCQTEFILFMHSDVILKQYNFFSKMLQWIEGYDIIGFQLSERDWIPKDWPPMVSHTATLCRAESIQRAGALWNFRAGLLNFPELQPFVGKMDTEFGWNLFCRRAGLRFKLLEQEPNEPYENEFLAHNRSLTVRTIFGKEGP